MEDIDSALEIFLCMCISWNCVTLPSLPQYPSFVDPQCPGTWSNNLNTFFLHRSILDRCSPRWLCLRSGTKWVTAKRKIFLRYHVSFAFISFRIFFSSEINKKKGFRNMNFSRLLESMSSCFGSFISQVRMQTFNNQPNLISSRLSSREIESTDDSAKNRLAEYCLFRRRKGRFMIFLNNSSYRSPLPLVSGCILRLRG